MNTAPCTDTRRPAVITWRPPAERGLAFVFEVHAGAWHWRLDAPNASNSRGYPTYPAAMAAARAHHGLPAIGESLS